MKLRWGIGVGLVVLSALAGCDVSVGNCDRDDAGSCFNGGFPEWDAGPGIDSGNVVPTNDGAVTADTGVSDAALVADGGTLDSSVPDASVPTTLAKGAFCDAQYTTAKRWLSLLENLSCPCDSAEDRDGRDFFLESALRFKGGIASCTEAIDRIVAVTTYKPENAAKCAAAFDAQFQSPAVPTTCPATGFDIASLEAMIGHGSQTLAQIPDCRATFVGATVRDAACTESLQCAAGLRCLTIPGGGSKSCQPARTTTESCSGGSDCADGHLCSGTGATGKTCIKTGQLDLKTQGGNCEASFECINGLICDGATFKCVVPVADVICKL